MSAFFIVSHKARKKRYYIIRAEDPLHAVRRFMRLRRLHRFDGEVAGPYITHDMAMEVINYFEGIERVREIPTNVGIARYNLN